MKVRTDFVTNSSSSSFILARKAELSEKQKEAIVKFVVERMLGEKAEIPKDKVEEYLDENYFDERYKDDICRALDEGKSIYTGWVSFEESDYQIENLFEGLWKALEKADSEAFCGIDTDLSY